MHRIGLTGRYLLVVVVSSLISAIAVSFLLAGGLRERALARSISEVEATALPGVQTLIFSG